MARDDSTLYTGMTSTEGKKARQARKEAQRKKEKVRGQLMPAAEIVGREVVKIREEIRDELRNAVDLKITEPELKALVMGLKIAEDRVGALKTRLDTIMRTPQFKEIEDDELDLG